MLSYRPTQSIPNMLNGGDMIGEYAGHARTGMFSASRNCLQILATWGCASSFMLQHEVMVVDEMLWMDAINKMHLCSLSITHVCPSHKAIHAVCHQSCTVKTGIHLCREHISKVPDAFECEHLPTPVSYDDKLQSG